MSKKEWEIKAIPVEQLEIDPMNVRAGEDFGDEEDEMLGKNIVNVGQLEDLKVRPRGDKFGVVAGRRTFLSTKDKVKFFRCKVRDMTDEEAVEVSLSDNIFTKSLNALTRAEALQKLVEKNPKGAAAVARRLGIPKSSMSEYLSVLKLTDDVKDALHDNLIAFRDAKIIAQKNLTEEEQNKLVEIIREKGKPEFKEELTEMLSKMETRGAPKGLFVVRCVLPNDTRPRLERFAKESKMELADYCERVLVDHVKSKV